MKTEKCDSKNTHPIFSCILGKFPHIFKICLLPIKITQGPSFTRRNVYLRDGYRCQYCGETFAAKDLTFDHVFPRSLGGSLSWENTVTCCKKCNSKKGNLTLNQLKRVGMELLNEPRQPTVYELASMERKFSPRRLHDTWQPFLPEYL